ncbi:SPFH domain-containing protein [Testudinibacter sp. P80/BLE/0925]|uniref:prohibitin family protein n=1 Tax=Testudinibacter sp. TW-1 TaxID=3417757 RepID=UPI003D369768
MPNKTSKISLFVSKISTFVAIILFGIFLLLSGIYTVDEGERAVKLRYGKIIDIAEPGLGFKIPFIDSIKKISVQNKNAIANNVQAYSRDQQPAVLTVSVSYHIPPSEVSALYSQYGSEENMRDRLLTRQLYTQIENIFGKYNAITAVQERPQFVQELSDAVKKAVSGPVIIDGVQVENIDFSDAYEKSIEDRMKAEVAIATRRQNLETEKINAEIAVTQAKAQADARLASAHAEAEAIRLKGAAEAEAIKLRGEALRQNPSLVNLTSAEKWNGELPQTMIPGSSVPFLQLPATAVEKAIQ